MKKIFTLFIAIFCVTMQIFADTVQGSTTTPDKGRPEHVYSNGDTYTYEGSLSSDEVSVSTAGNEFAIVSINDTNNTITVNIATLPTQPKCEPYEVAWVYPKQQTNVGAANSSEENGVYTLYNKVLAASYMKLGSALYFAGSEAMNLVPGTELFTVAFGNGDNVPASAMTLKDVKLESLTGNENAIGGAEHFDGKQLVAKYEYSYNNTKLEIVWRAVLRDGSHYLRTEMELKGIDNVDMFNVIPMIYNVDTNAAGSTPAEIGNTRGKVLLSDKIFAGLDTPTAYNTVGEASGESDPWELAETKPVANLSASDWKQVPAADVPYRVKEVSATDYPYIYAYTMSNVSLKKGQKVEVEIKWKSGSNKLNLCGVDLVDQNGDNVANHYRVGTTGNEHVNNVYSFEVPSNGTFSIRSFAQNNNEAINASSSITVKIYNAKEGAVITKAIVGIQGRWSRNTTLAAGETWKVGSVVGLVAQDGTQNAANVHDSQKRRSFLAYSERERAVPWRAFPCYISWYELNIDRNNASPGREHLDNMNADQVLNVLNNWKTAFYNKYNEAPAAFIIDDGWDEYGTWTFHDGFPNEMVDIAALAKTMNGAGVGAWLGPVGGYGGSGTHRRNYWNGKGGMQLSNPAYYQVFKDAAYNLVKNQGSDNYVFFKFDGISGQPVAVGPDAGDTGNENAEGIIRLERYVREELRADIFFNTTVGTWASPFWYQITDATWRQENDYGEIGNSSIDREKWITYRDNLVHQNYVSNSPICPINTLMTHGFILSKWGNVSKNMDYNAVLREMRCAFLCGSGMVELYNDYELMNSINNGKLWEDLAECIAWQRKNADVLPDAHWVGGDPWTGSKHEVYGWASWNGEKATLALRNGSTSPQTYTFTLRKALEIPANINASIIFNKSFEVQEALSGFAEGEAINIDEEITITLPASSVFAFDGRDSGVTPEPLPEKFTIKNVTPAAGEVTEISQIRVNPELGASLAELPTNWKLTDAKGGEYTIKTEWLYDYEEVLVTVNPTITEPGKYTLTIPSASLKTDDGKEVARTSFTWVIKADLGDAYRIKSTSQNKYLNIEGYNKTNSSGAKGSVGIAAYNDGEGAENQIFYIVEEDNNTYLLSESGHYIVCRPWNIDACEGEKSPLSLTDAGNGLYYIMNGSQYFKVGPVNGDESSYYPYCDAPLNLAEKWELEKVGGEDVSTAISNVESNAEVTIYDLTGRKIEKITSAGIYVINGNKVLVK
ncbi:MAG: hypothetical protein IKV17_01710 [Bacteroidaceae bacterium]|nr:hypothetical protein [Bacteroidaceae bacterium]